MPVRLTSKLTIAIAAAILPVIAINSGLRVSREIDLYEANLRDDNVLLGRAVAAAVTAVWRTAGEKDARLLIDATNERERHADIRWVNLDAHAGDPEASSVVSRMLATVREHAPVTLRGRRVGDATDSILTYVAAPVPTNPRGAIELHESLSSEATFISHTIRHAAIATSAVVGLCTILALGLGLVFVGRPMRRLVIQARRIGEGDLSRRLHLRQRDEFGVLAFELDDMCDRLAAARDRVAAESAARIAAREQLRHADRLMTAGKLAAGIAHEIGTPLNVISGHAQLIIDEYPANTSAYDNATIVVEQTHRLAAIIRQLLDFARRRPAQRTVQDVTQIVRRTAELLQPLAENHGLTIAIETPGSPVEARLDAGQIQQAIMNLAVNGIQAMTEGGRLTVSTGSREATPPAGSPASAERYAWVEVADTGQGIPPDVLPRIFEPFFTTKGVGDGSGLGLSVTYGIVEEHGGWIGVDTTAGTGSRFTIYLPLEGAAIRCASPVAS